MDGLGRPPCTSRRLTDRRKPPPTTSRSCQLRDRGDSRARRSARCRLGRQSGSSPSLRSWPAFRSSWRPSRSLPGWPDPRPNVVPTASLELLLWPLRRLGWRCEGGHRAVIAALDGLGAPLPLTINDTTTVTTVSGSPIVCVATIIDAATFRCKRMPIAYGWSSWWSQVRNSATPARVGKLATRLSATAAGYEADRQTVEACKPGPPRTCS